MAETIKILVVDDKVELRQNIRRLIGFEEGMEVAGEAANGQECLDRARELRPDVILMDINMPVMDGITATEMLSQEMPDISIVLMSVQGEQELIRKAMKAGARDFLVKPFSTEDLIETIKQCFRADQKRRQMFQPAAAAADTSGRRKMAKVVTFFSPKGGVGKTVCLANTAIALAHQTGRKVAILDCDLQFGDTAIMFNLYPSRTIANLVEEPPPWTSQLVQEYMIRHEESGVDVLLSPSRPEYAEIVQVEHIEQVLTLLRESYDYILIDTVPMFRNIELSILDQSDRIFVVVTLELSAIKDVKLCLDLLGNLNYPPEKVAVVLNKGYPTIGGLTIEDLRAGLKRDIEVVIPTDGKAVLESINRGRPYLMVASAAQTDLGRAFTRIASMVSGESLETQETQETAGESIFKRLFRRA